MNQLYKELFEKDPNYHETEDPTLQYTEEYIENRVNELSNENNQLTM